MPPAPHHNPTSGTPAAAGRVAREPGTSVGRVATPAASVSGVDAAREHGIALVAVAPGAGKSHAVGDLLEDPLTYQRYDLVVYCAPTWTVIEER